MPLYYFDCDCDGVLHPDGCGVELAPDEVADEARGILLELMNQAIPDAGACRVSVVVRDADRVTVHTVQACVSESARGGPS